MNIKIIEPIGQSETAIRSRLRNLVEKGGHRLFICDTRGLTDAELIQNVSDAVGIDVFDIEPPLPTKHSIFKAPNTVLLSHIGFETVEAMSTKADIALHHLENFLSGHGRAS
jgi:phosphoglycerate dehydrogenase-like enzyme